MEFGRLRERLVSGCLAELGAERARAVEPMRERFAVERELDRTAEALAVVEASGGLPLDGLADLRPLVARAAIGAALDPDELLRVARTLAATRLTLAFTHGQRERAPLLAELAADLVVHEGLEQAILRAVDDTGGGLRDSASPELGRIRRELIGRSAHLRRRMDEILRSLSDRGLTAGAEQVTLREGRMVVPLKREHKRQVAGFVHDTSGSGQTIYVEPAEMLDLNNDLRELRSEEFREIDRILRDLTDGIRCAAEPIRANQSLLGELDFLQAKARLARDLGATRPALSDDGRLTIIDGRHPLLLLTRPTVVPLTLSLGAPDDTGKVGGKVLVITGPNAGGKSVAMKTAGLLCLMVQSGLLVPCFEESSFPLLDALFVDIGDEQSIDNDLSTFSSHLVNVRAILRHATGDSLVLIDEIGTGTDPAEGGAMAQAVLETLLERGCLTVVTTHHGELKAFAHETAGVVNGSMAFDQATLSPTYRFRAGIPGSSYAFEIAGRLGLPRTMLTRARTLVGSSRARLEGLLTSLEAAEATARRTATEAQRERERLAGLIQLYEGRTAEAEARVKGAKREAAAEAERLLTEARRTVEQAVKSAREATDAEAVKEARRQLESGRESARRVQLDNPPPPDPPAELSDEFELLSEDEPLRKGDAVILKTNGATGIVQEAPDAAGNVKVAFGSVAMRVKVRAVQPVRSKRQQKKQAVYYDTIGKQIQTSVDLRGLMGDEAIPVLETFLAEAYAFGLNRVTIVHGKGTGALRTRVTEFLRVQPRIKAFSLGNWNEGGSGATVVEF